MKIWLRVVALVLSMTVVGAYADTSIERIAPDQLAERIEKKDADLVVLDVRTPEEFAAGHVPGARNIPHDQLASRVSELADAKDKQLVVYCRSGRRSDVALATLSAQGFKKLQHLDGDMLQWEAKKLPVQK